MPVMPLWSVPVPPKKPRRQLVALVADDTPHLLEAMDEAVCALGFITRTVGDGRAAIAALAGPNRFDLLVTDLQMPHAGGFEVIEAWLAGGRPADAIILATAAASSTEVRRRAASLGVQLVHKRNLIDGLTAALVLVLPALIRRAGEGRP